MVLNKDTLPKKLMKHLLIFITDLASPNSQMKIHTDRWRGFAIRAISFATIESDNEFTKEDY
jgi:hypothetical protein